MYVNYISAGGGGIEVIDIFLAQIVWRGGQVEG